jgi:SAM-dependent methyltransferase
MLSAEDVSTIYRALLDRDPSQSEIEHQRADCATVLELRRALLRSGEFQAHIVPQGRPHDWPPIRIDVDVDVSDDQLHQMIERIERKFHYLGETEPHWSVLSIDRFRTENLDEAREDEFFESGSGDLKLLRAGAARCGIDLDEFKTCFELGCGLGRTTRWLATQFEHVFGADISASHLTLARAAMNRFGVNNVTLLHVNTINALKGIPPFDVFLSVIVLQHNPPPVIAHLLRTVFGKLNPGGLAYFQVLTHHTDYRFDAAEYLASEITLGHAEMHFMPQPAIFRIAEEAGCWPLEVREDSGEGNTNNLSQRFLLRKKSLLRG